MKRPKKPATEWWKETLAHIDETWKKKKGRSYPFTGQDLKLLKLLRNCFTAQEVLALWDCYLRASPFWGQKTGFLIAGLFAERSVLLDDLNFKKLTAKYEAEFGMREAKEVGTELFPR